MVKIDYIDNIAYVNLPQKTNVQHVIEAMGKLFSNPDYRLKPLSIWKFHEIELDVTPTDLKAIKDFVTANRGNIPAGKAAVIVKSNNQRGTILIYELISYKLPVEIKIFDSYDEGLDWIKSTLQI